MFTQGSRFVQRAAPVRLQRYRAARQALLLGLAKEEPIYRFQSENSI
jgi:hypothetical protein